MKFKGPILITRNKKSYKVGTIHTSKSSGDFIVTKIETSKRVHVEFIKTEFETITSGSHIIRGEVKDLLYPATHNKGYLGEDYYNILDKYDYSFIRILYGRWTGMIRRCYCEKDKKYDIYGGAGVRVSDRWLNFSNYFYDVQKLPGYDYDLLIDSKITLDKYKLQPNVKTSKKVYSKDTCCWLTYEEQNSLVDFKSAHEFEATKFKMIFPDGTCEERLGIKAAEREYGFPRGSISKGLSRGFYKDIKLEKIE